DEFLHISHTGPDALQTTTAAPTSGTNVDVSNECGPQSETFIAINPSNPKQLAGGSNEIFRLPMRAYFSSDGGQTWGGSDLPLPPVIGTNGVDFGSDPGVAFDSSNNLYTRTSSSSSETATGRASRARSWQWRARPTAAA